MQIRLVQDCNLGRRGDVVSAPHGTAVAAMMQGLAAPADAETEALFTQMPKPSPAGLKGYDPAAMAAALQAHQAAGPDALLLRIAVAAEKLVSLMESRTQPVPQPTKETP